MLPPQEPAGGACVWGQPPPLSVCLQDRELSWPRAVPSSRFSSKGLKEERGGVRGQGRGSATLRLKTAHAGLSFSPGDKPTHHPVMLAAGALPPGGAAPGTSQLGRADRAGSQQKARGEAGVPGSLSDGGASSSAPDALEAASISTSSPPLSLTLRPLSGGDCSDPSLSPSSLPRHHPHF